MTKQARGLAEALSGGGQQIHGGLRLDAHELVEIAAVDDESVEVFEYERGRHTRAAVEERHLAEKVPLPRRLENNLVARVVLERDLDHTLSYHVHRVAGVAVVKDEVSRGHG